MTTWHITLLTRADCAFCDRAKATLDELTGEFDLAIEEIPIDSDTGRTLAAEAGVLFPPGVLIDGTAFSHGRLSARKLRRTLQSNPGSSRPASQ